MAKYIIRLVKCAKAVNPRQKCDLWQPRVHLFYGGYSGEVFVRDWQRAYPTRGEAIAHARQHYPDAEVGADMQW